MDEGVLQHRPAGGTNHTVSHLVAKATGKQLEGRGVVERLVCVVRTEQTQILQIFSLFVILDTEFRVEGQNIECRNPEIYLLSKPYIRVVKR